MLQGYKNPSESVLRELVLTKCLLILMYGVECFSLLVEQKRKLCVAFNTVIRHILKLSQLLPCMKLLYILDQNQVKY